MTFLIFLIVVVVMNAGFIYHRFQRKKTLESAVNISHLSPIHFLNAGAFLVMVSMLATNEGAGGGMGGLIVFFIAPIIIYILSNVFYVVVGFLGAVGPGLQGGLGGKSQDPMRMNQFQARVEKYHREVERLPVSPMDFNNPVSGLLSEDWKTFAARADRRR